MYTVGPTVRTLVAYMRPRDNEQLYLKVCAIKNVQEFEYLRSLTTRCKDIKRAYRESVWSIGVF